jgi:hypothetical protein
VGGGIQLGPLGTATTIMPIVPAAGDYVDGEIGGMIGRGNRTTSRKPAPVPLCPLQTHMLANSNPGGRGGKPATNRLSYGTAKLMVTWSLRWIAHRAMKMELSDNFHVMVPFTSEEGAVGTHWIGAGGSEGPKAGLDSVEKKKVSCPCRE